MLPTSFEALAAEITSPSGLIELATLFLMGAFAWLLAARIRARLPDTTTPGLVKIGAGSAHRIVFPLALVAFTWVARVLLARYQSVAVLNLALPLITSYAVIRLAVYLLRHLIAPSALLKASERAIALSVWILVALYLVGVLPEILAALDEVRFSVNKQSVSLKNVIEGTLLLTVTLFVALALSRIVEKRIMATTTVDIGSRVVVTRFLRAGALLLAVLLVLPLVGIDLTMLSIFGGALGVGLGFGLQKITSNYVSGFIILLDKSTRLGDTITVDNRHGVVKSIRARYTVVRADDGTEALIPNDTFITHVVMNHSHAAGTNALANALTLTLMTKRADQATRGKAELLAAIDALIGRGRMLRPEPTPTAHITRLYAGGADITATAWVEAEANRDDVRSTLLAEIARRFAVAGIEIG